MEDKISPKFVLPSPKFTRTENEANRTTMHYLTPSGMTLLPRAKQPPPMYGARGSTVPAKFLHMDQSPITSMTQDPPIYKSPPRPEHCHNCGMELANAQDMRRHLEQHEECPSEGCDFAALHNILERHIEANHITGIYQKVKKVWTPEDTAAWRAERRKKFPTAANVELAKRVREQRLKRGERLEVSKSRFGSREDRARTRPNNSQEKRPKSNKKGKGNSQHVEKKRDDESICQKTEALEEQTSLLSETGVPMFRGTAQMLGYEHSKDSVQKKENVLCGLLGMYGSDSEDSEIETEEETDKSQGQKSLQLGTELQVQTAICSTVENEGSMVDLVDPNTDIQNITFKEHISSEEQLKESDSSSEEAPDEAPIQRVTEEISEPAINEHQFIKPNPRPSPKPAAPKAQKRISGLNYKRARKATKQNTMLSKLLASDIHHERNVLLQCVRYVCENKFFGIGASGSGGSKKENDLA